MARRPSAVDGRRVGRIQLQGSRARGLQRAHRAGEHRRLVDAGHAHVHIQNVRPGPHLGHGLAHQVVEVARLNGRAQLLLPRGVDTLADDRHLSSARGQTRHLLSARHRESGPIGGCAGAPIAQQARQSGDVRRRGATAAAHHGRARIQNGRHSPREVLRPHVEHRAPILYPRQPRVGLGHEQAPGERRRLGCQGCQLVGAERAVEAHRRRAQRRQRGCGDSRRSAEEGAAVLPEAHGGEHGQRGLLHGGEHGRLRLQQIGHGLHHDEIAAGRLGRSGLLSEDVVGLVEGEAAQGCEQAARGTDIPGNQRRAGGPGHLDRRRVHLGHRRPRSRQLQAVRAEGVGGDALGTRFHVLVLDGGDLVGMRQVQHIGVLVHLRQPRLLHEGAHAAVEEQEVLASERPPQQVAFHPHLTRESHSFLPFPRPAVRGRGIRQWP